MATSHVDGKVRIWDTRQQSEVQCRGTFCSAGSSHDRQWVTQVSPDNLIDPASLHTDQTMLPSGEMASFVRALVH